MALSLVTLTDELKVGLAPGAENPPQEISAAFGRYFGDSIANGIPVTKESVTTLAVPAMTAAMAFLPGGTPADGAAVFVAGFTAFWGAMSAAPPSFFTGATVITPPPGLATLAAAIVSAFALNLLATELAVAAANLAAVFHPSAGLGGTATFPGPVVAPIL